MFFNEYMILCILFTSEIQTLCSMTARARPIRFFWADTDVFRYPMPIFLYFSSSIYFASWGKITTPGAILPSAKLFQTTAERHYSAYFPSGHINKENNFTSYNYFMRQNIHYCFALRQNIHSWSYFATSRTWLAELLTWQVWPAWLSQLTVTSVNGSVW